jgi:hypothetical protein
MENVMSDNTELQATETTKPTESETRIKARNS